MANTLFRDRAIELRSLGLSLNQITEKLKIPKSTVRYWCRDVILSRKQLEVLYERQRLGGIKAAEQIRKKRISLVKHLLKVGRTEIGQFSQRDLWMVGIGLYWAEGYRKGDGEFGFVNSDPKVIEFIIKWLRLCCGVPREKIHLRVCINFIHHKRMFVVQNFWSGITKIPLSQFSKPTLIRVVNKKTYAQPKNYYGTLRIKVRRSTNLRRKIIGWIGGVAGGIKAQQKQEVDRARTIF